MGGFIQWQRAIFNGHGETSTNTGEPRVGLARSGLNRLFMKKSKTKVAAVNPAPVFQVVVRQRGVKRAAENPKSETRENTFSKSRDTREDRGARQKKTAHSSQTFPHTR